MSIMRKLFSRRGQATTEMVLLFPLFLIFIIFMAKIFSLLVLRQKMEIASVYAAKRYQMESHLTYTYAEGWDKNFLEKDIGTKVSDYIGFSNKAVRNFLNLRYMDFNIKKDIQWNEVSLTVYTDPPKIGILCKYNKLVVCDDYRIQADCLKGFSYLCESGVPIKVIKYVPNRDRPVPFPLPAGSGSRKKGKVK